VPVFARLKGFSFLFFWNALDNSSCMYGSYDEYNIELCYYEVDYQKNHP
jgi:hypothetical protein